MRDGHHAGGSDDGWSVMNWLSEEVLLAVKECEHAYEVTGIPHGVCHDLSIEIWTPNRSYLETVGVNATAKRMGDHVYDDNPDAYH